MAHASGLNAGIVVEARMRCVVVHLDVFYVYIALTSALAHAAYQHRTQRNPMNFVNRPLRAHLHDGCDVSQCSTFTEALTPASAHATGQVISTQHKVTP